MNIVTRIGLFMLVLPVAYCIVKTVWNAVSHIKKAIREKDIEEVDKLLAFLYIICIIDMVIMLFVAVILLFIGTIMEA